MAIRTSSDNIHNYNTTPETVTIYFSVSSLNPLSIFKFFFNISSYPFSGSKQPYPVPSPVCRWSGSPFQCECWKWIDHFGKAYWCFRRGEDYGRLLCLSWLEKVDFSWESREPIVECHHSPPQLQYSSTWLPRHLTWFLTHRLSWIHRMRESCSSVWEIIREF